MLTETDCFVAMVAAAYWQAIADATRGQEDAIEWLNCMLPNWKGNVRRGYVHSAGKSRKKRAASYTGKNRRNPQRIAPFQTVNS